LDEALIRPGRVDLKLALSHANETQIQSLFLNFYPESNIEMAAKFSSEIVDAQLSMAHIQGHFLRNKNNPAAAIEGAKALIEKSSSAL
jgi:ATP-dependent 26S proteasome regulatory subunit